MKQQTKFKQTEIGKIPEDWEVRQIRDIVKINEKTINKNYAYKEIEYIDIDSVNQGCLSESQHLSLHEAPSRAKRIIQENDIIISTVRPNLKHFAFIKKSKPNTVVSTGFAVITSKKVIPQFIYYYLTTEQYTDFLSSIADSHTSTYPAFNPDIIEKSLIPFPSLPEQQAIASILSNLDSKIELNHRMNKTLEAIGQAIFKRWFVDFEFPDEKGKPYKSSGGEMINSELGKIPKGWEVGRLGDYVNLIKGCSYKSDDLKNSNVALVTLKSINRGGGFNIEGYKEYIGEYRQEQVLNEGEVVVAQTDITQQAEVIGKPALVYSFGKYNKLIASLDLQIVRPKDSINRDFLYYLLKTKQFNDHAFSYTNGTTVLHLDKNAIPDFDFLLPDKKILDKFDLITNKIINKIYLNDKQSQVLSQIRDSLLPKLMSGKIRVK